MQIGGAGAQQLLQRVPGYAANSLHVFPLTGVKERFRENLLYIAVDRTNQLLVVEVEAVGKSRASPKGCNRYLRARLKMGGRGDR